MMKVVVVHGAGSLGGVVVIMVCVNIVAAVTPRVIMK